MPRRRFLITYDIRDQKRLRRVHKLMKGFGWPMQYSVFISDLDKMELIEMRQQLAAEINQTEDSIAVVDVGNPEQRGRECFDFLGIAPALPKKGPLIL